MGVHKIPTEEIGELTGMSRSAALCCAIIEDAESAHEFGSGQRSPMDLLCVTRFAPASAANSSPPLYRELTSLIA